MGVRFRSIVGLALCLNASGVRGGVGLGVDTPPGDQASPADPGRDETERPAPRRMLLVDDATEPTVTVRWRSRGTDVEHECVRGFSAPGLEEPIDGTNLKASVSLGGTRLETGAGHPNGVILRVELRKIDEGRALLSRVDPGSSVHIEVRGVRFNQPVRAEAGTALMHLRYARADVENCGLPPSATSQFLLADPDDTLGGMVHAGENATPGGLSGAPGAGSVEARVEDDGTVTFGVTVPFGLLRHLQDPWASDLPGTFFEPVRLHAEVEVLPVWAEPIVRENPPLDKPVERPTLGD